MSARKFNVEIFTELGVGAMIVSLRTYARWSSVGFRLFMVDDYLMLFALIVYALETVAAYAVGSVYHGLANNSMSDEYRQYLPLDSDEYHMRVGGARLQLIGWSLYTLLLWLLKTCMCVFYTRLTTGLYHMRMRTNIAFGAIAISYAIVVAMILGACGLPFSKNWQIYPNPGNQCQPAVSRFDLFFTVTFNVATDLWLILIPLPMVWKAQIPIKRKIQLLVLFSGGIFVMAAGILRCVLILFSGPNGAQQAGSWAVRESFVAVIIGNLPMIQPLFTRTVKHISSGLSQSFGSEPPSNSSIQLKDYSRRRQPRSANPLTLSSSQEYIVEERRQRRSQHGNQAQRNEEERDKGGIHVASETFVDYESVKTADVEANGVGLGVGNAATFKCNVSA